MKNISYFLQAIALKSLFFFFKLMPPKKSSNLGGAIVVLFNPFLRKQNKHALQNLTIAFPDKTKDEKAVIIKKMWRNIGMNLGEYPHLLNSYNDHPDFNITHRGQDHLCDTTKATVYISAHLGNWEILPLSVAKFKRPFFSLYRPPNNPYIRQQLNRFRTLDGALPEAYTKGNKGFISLARHLKNGEDIGILLDQRHSGGESVRFFDHDVDASFAPIDLALKYNTQLIMGRVIRHGACSFTLDALPPLDTQNRTRTDIMQDIYNHYEDWIKEYPEQWLWMHRRFGKDL